MAKKKSESEALCVLAVQFGKVTFGEGSLSIPIRVERSKIALGAADKMFVGRRLTCSLEVGQAGDDQKELFDKGTGVEPIESVAESKRMAVGKKHFGATLNFLLEGVDDGNASHFANKAGTLTVTGVEDLPEAKRGRPPKSAEADGDDDGDEEE